MMQMVRQVKLKFKQSIKWMLKPMLVQLMDFAVKHPSLKVWAMTWVQKYPWIETRLYRLAVNSGRSKVGLLGQSASNPALNVPGDLATEESQLPLASYLIYRELNDAIAARQGERA